MLTGEDKNNLYEILEKFINDNFYRSFSKEKHKDELIKNIKDTFLSNSIDLELYDINVNKKVQGLYYTKSINIVIVDKDNYKENHKWEITEGVIEIISFIAPIYSIKKNIEFFLEQVLAEINNYKKIWLEYSLFLFLPKKIPQLWKNTDIRNREIIDFEEINLDDYEINLLLNLFNKWLIDNIAIFYYEISRYKWDIKNTIELIDSKTTIFLEDTSLFISEDYTFEQYIKNFNINYN